MSTRYLDHDNAVRVLVTQIKKRLIGQDVVAAAFAAEICRHIALTPLQRRPGIFLVAGPNVEDEQIGLASGLSACFKSGGGLYDISSGQGDDLARLVSVLSPEGENRTLMQSLKDYPDAVCVLQDIDKAHPNLLEQLMSAWSQGYIDDNAGETIPLADVIFVLTTEVAQDRIGQIARGEPDPDRLHVECQKALLDAGFPASLLKFIDVAFALKSLTPGEVVLEHCRSFFDQVASHGLVLEDGGIDARILAHAIDPSIEAHIAEAWLIRDELDARLAQASAAGVHTVRLVLGEETINVVPVGEPLAQVEAIPPADAEPLSSPDGETARE